MGREPNMFDEALRHSRERTRLMVDRGVWPPEALLGLTDQAAATIRRIRWTGTFCVCGRHMMLSDDGNTATCAWCCRMLTGLRLRKETRKMENPTKEGWRMFVLALALAAGVYALGVRDLREVEAHHAEALAQHEAAHAAEVAEHVKAREALAVRTLELLQVMCLKGLPYPLEVTGGKFGPTTWPKCTEIVPQTKGAKP